MSIFSRRDPGPNDPLIPPRPGSRRTAAVVTSKAAMQQSVIWAAVNIFASLESLMPADVYREIDGIKVSVPLPPVLVSPSSFAEGHPDSLSDWLYARRVALKSSGNCFGEITAVDGLGKPAQIQLVPSEDVTCKVKNYRIVEYRFGRTVMEPRKVWHDRDNLMPGVPIGLSPIAYAMMTIQTQMSAMQFIAEWFGNGAVPAAHLKNTNRNLIPDKPGKPGEAVRVKAKFNRDVANGDVFVTGNEWTYTAIQAKAAESGWMDLMNFDAVELCRFQNTPASLIDVATQGTARITYQNITDAALDFMVTRMGPGLKRTDDALTSLTPTPRFVRLNRNAVLAMDPKATADLMKVQIDSRTRVPSELRRLQDLPPLTDAEYAEFDRLFGSKNPIPTPKGLPA